MGTYPISADPVFDAPIIYYWDTHEAGPLPVKNSVNIAQGYAAGTAGNTYDVAYPPRSVLSNEGHFNSITRNWSQTAGQRFIQFNASDGTSWYNNRLRTSTWILPAAGGATCTETAGSDTMPFHASPDLTWGYTVAYDQDGNETGPHAGQILAPHSLPALAFDPIRVRLRPGFLLPRGICGPACPA